MKPLSILVVEDNALLGELLGELLTEMGHHVCAVATDEAGAVAAAILHRPTLMIVDATLGDGSGVRAVETAQRSGLIPHVFVTGDANRVRQNRPDAIVLQKPFSESDLARAIALAAG